jgi:hypothetical protein
MSKIAMMGSSSVEDNPKREAELKLKGSKNVIETADQFAEKLAWRRRPQSMEPAPAVSYRKARFN